MTMGNLPSAQTLANLVSRVTHTMCGITFVPTTEEPAPGLFWRTATLPIEGARPLRISISSDRPGCGALGAALYSIPAESLDDAMIDDSLCELLNMAAGQIKRFVVPDQALGLPRIARDAELSEAARRALVRAGMLLRSRGKIDLLICIEDRPR
jgi:hypothetical protein